MSYTPGGWTPRKVVVLFVALVVAVVAVIIGAQLGLIDLGPAPNNHSVEQLR